MSTWGVTGGLWWLPGLRPRHVIDKSTKEGGEVFLLEVSAYTNIFGYILLREGE